MGLSNGSAFVPCDARLLLRIKMRALRNHAWQVVSETPIKIFAAGAFVGLIWIALYYLFLKVFQFFRASSLQSVVAIPLLFQFFFFALLVLLTFSNAILIYGALFKNEESSYLLAAPLRPHSVIKVKYAEGLFFASWSLILLGLPLMFAIADVHDESSAAFYVLFVSLFLAFVPIPGALGLLTAWAVARYLPRSARRVLVFLAMVGLAAAIVWGMRSVRDFRWGGRQWLEGFFARLALVRLSLLPSTWVTRGIERALTGEFVDAVRYLVVVLANGLFLSWLAVHVVARRFIAAFDRAGSTSGDAGRRSAESSSGWAGWVFFFLPRRARLIAAKDLRHFTRDPMQWSQLAILFGLMGLYLLNMPRFDLGDSTGRWRVVVPFLNLTAVSFILATFTSRFVFPMVSMERHQFWILGLLPISRAWILIAKFAFAMVVTFGVAAAVMLLASQMLRFDWRSTLLHLAITASVCFGLCGLAVGAGARFPVLTDSNPARIANGLGGTLNLVASVLMITLVLGAVAAASYLSRDSSLSSLDSRLSVAAVACAIILGPVVGLAAMVLGARHLNRLEF